jgi:hypothetical protein
MSNAKTVLSADHGHYAIAITITIAMALRARCYNYNYKPTTTAHNKGKSISHNNATHSNWGSPSLAYLCGCALFFSALHLARVRGLEVVKRACVFGAGVHVGQARDFIFVEVAPCRHAPVASRCRMRCLGEAVASLSCHPCSYHVSSANSDALPEIAVTHPPDTFCAVYGRA